MSNKFDYKYSAPTEEERREIDNIRRQYEPHGKNQTKLDRLRKLDQKVKSTALCISLSVGIAGCLVFGLGLSMFLEWSIYLWGVVVSVIGAIAMIFAYPLHKYMLNKGKLNYCEEILKLSGELLNENTDKNK